MKDDDCENFEIIGLGQFDRIARPFAVTRFGPPDGYRVPTRSFAITTTSSVLNSTEWRRVPE
jgi:hypothetical protein